MSHPALKRLAAVTTVAVTAVTLSVPLAQAASAKEAKETLRSEAPRDLRIGSAVWGQRDLLDHDRKAPTRFQRILAAEFDSVTPENDMKWAEIHPEPGVYDFSGADAVVEFAEANDQEVRGHTLLWHSQNPQWVVDASATWTCEEARDVLEGPRPHRRRPLQGRDLRVGRRERDLPGRRGHRRRAPADRGQPLPQGVLRRPGGSHRRRLPVGARGRSRGAALPQRLQRRGHQQQDRRLLRAGAASCSPTACRCTASAPRVT